MFSSSFPELSFTEYSAQNNAAGFLVISDKEQNILENIPGWQTHNKNNQQLQARKEFCKKRNENAEEVRNTTKQREFNTTKQKEFNTSRLSSSQENLLASMNQGPSIYLNKSKSFPDLTTKNNDLNDNRLLQKCVSSSEVPYDIVFHRSKSLTNLKNILENKTEPMNKFLQRMAKFKKKLQLNKESVISDIVALQSNKHFNVVNVNKPVDVNNEKNIYSYSSFNNEKENFIKNIADTNQQNNTSAKKICIRDQNFRFVEDVTVKDPNHLKVTNEVALQNSLNGQDLCEKYILNFISSIPTTTTLPLFEVRQSQDGIELLPTTLANAPYLLSANNQNCDSIQVQQNAETSIYIIGDDTQKVCQDISEELLSNSWVTAADINAHGEKSTIIPTTSASDVQNKTVEDTELLQCSNELFNLEQELHEVKIPSPTINARRKLEFNQITPITNRRNILKQHKSPKYIDISPEIEPLPKPIENEPADKNSKNSPQTKTFIDEIKRPFTFTPSQVRTMAELIWEIYS